MAFGDVDMSKIKEGLNPFKDRGETGDFMKLTPLTKCFKACGLEKYTKTLEAQSFPALQGKDKKVSFETIVTKLLDDVAARYVGTQENMKGKAPDDHPKVQAVANEIKAKIAAFAGKSAVKAAAVDATTARLTDVSGYTGSHKERFGTDGKGKGLEGRADLVENSGYVGAYKGTGTFGKK